MAAPAEAKPSVAAPLAQEHLPIDRLDTSTVTLASIRNVKNVNLISSRQPLEFRGEGLNIVYGDNASGKSGYARILKLACRARSKPKRILPNVFSDGVGPPEAVVTFKCGSNEQSYNWTDGQTGLSILASVSVFDSNSASCYVADANDVAFRPFGLDLLDKLAAACTTLKKTLEQEKIAVAFSKSDFTEFRADTAVGRYIGSLTPTSSQEILEKLAALSDDELKRLQFLNKRIAEIEANDPIVKAKEFKARATRLDELKKQYVTVSSALSNDGVQKLRAAAEAVNATTVAAKLASTDLSKTSL